MTLKKIVIIFFLIIHHSSSESLVFPPYGHSYGIRKATSKHLFMFFGPRTSFSEPQGLAVVRLESWDNPASKKDDDEVVVYGINSGRHQIVYNTSMWSLGLYGSKGVKHDQFFYPKGVAADHKGNVFVADSGNSRIVKLFNPKSALKWVSEIRSFNDKPLEGPSRVALDESGQLYVTEPKRNRILIFDSNGKSVSKIDGFEDGPTALAVADGRSRWSYYYDDLLIFCCDSKGRRVWRIDGNSKVRKTAMLPDNFSASFGAIDYYHNYWVTDTKNHCILKFNRELQLLDRFGSFGESDNQFVEPRGIAINKRFGQVFIAEKSGAQYYWIGSKLKNSALTKMEPKQISLDITTTEPSFVSLFSLIQKDTIFFEKRKMIFSGKSNLILGEPSIKDWEKKNFFLKIEPTYSSYTFSSWIYPIGIK